MRRALALLFRLVARLVFRLDLTGAEHLRAAGVIVVQGGSFLDALVTWALLDGEPAFVLGREDARHPAGRLLRRLARGRVVVPERPLALRRALRLLRAGQPLVVFIDGRVDAAEPMQAYEAAGLLALAAGAQVTPVRIEGLESTPFSRLAERQIKTRWCPKVRVTALPPSRLAVEPGLVGKARRRAAGKALYLVLSELMFRTARTDQTLFSALKRAAARHGASRVAVEDLLGVSLTYGRLLIGAAALARKLRPITQAGEPVGVLLPNAAGVAATFWALQMSGRVPAMLNYTAGPGNVQGACRTAQIKTVLSSRAFVDKAKLEDVIAAVEQVAAVVWLEDVRARIGVLDKIAAIVDRFTWRPQAQVDEPALILFTSGSEGTPKGVVLSHRNVLANCAQVASRIDFGPDDTLLNVLPVFHSFGMTGGLVLPAVYGVRLYLFPSPLLYKQVPEKIHQIKATALYGTDTFLMGYARAADPGDFRSVRLVVAGAEPVKPETRRLYAEKFGLAIYEGFGLTEAAPVVAVNTPLYHRAGSVGLPLPGIELRLEPVPGIDEGGRMWVKGPNVMLGYLRPENPGRLEPLADGWHDSGDIVALDADGFLSIKGRVKRFAKIAGEMVSLAAVENLVADLWPDNHHVAVALPDPRKGERIVLVTDRGGVQRSELIAHARRQGASELMTPAAILEVDALPVLGSGKVDHVSVRRLAADRLAEGGPAGAAGVRGN